MHIASLRISPPFPHAAVGRLVLSPVLLRLLRPVGLTTDVASYRLRRYLRHTPPPLSLWYTGEVFREEFRGWQVTYPLKQIYMQHFPQATK